MTPDLYAFSGVLRGVLLGALVWLLLWRAW